MTEIYNRFKYMIKKFLQNKRKQNKFVNKQNQKKKKIKHYRYNKEKMT